MRASGDRRSDGGKRLAKPAVGGCKCFDSPGGGHYYCAPMSRGTLPLYVEPFRLCDANARISGKLAASQLERISEFSVGTTDDVEVVLGFSRDADGRNRITGTVDTVVHTTCERCLKPLDIEVHVDIALMVVAAGSVAPETVEDVDIVQVEEERLSLAPLVEEEVLLALPHFPAHASCDMVAYDRGAGGSAARPQQKVNPFDVLAKLKQKD